MRNSMIGNKKPNWYKDAQWRWEFIGYGYVYLPNAEHKILRIEGEAVYNAITAMLEVANKTSRWRKLAKLLFQKLTGKKSANIGMTAFDLSIAEYEAAHQPATVIARRQARGKVIKNTYHAEFNPTQTRTGGRVVKAMPRKLQKIKQSQEKFEQEPTDGPRVEDLET